MRSRKTGRPIWPSLRPAARAGATGRRVDSAGTGSRDDGTPTERGARLSRKAVAKEVKARKLAALAVAGLVLERDLFIVWDRRRPLSPAARLFIDHLAPCPHKGAAP